MLQNQPAWEWSHRTAVASRVRSPPKAYPRTFLAVGPLIQTLYTSVYSRAPGAGPQLSDELVDALSETVSLPPDRAARSAAILRLIEEMHATLQWLRGSAAGNAELASLAQVVAAARAHQDRMVRR